MTSNGLKIDLKWAQNSNDLKIQKWPQTASKMTSNGLKIDLKLCFYVKNKALSTKLEIIVHVRLFGTLE